MARELLFSVTKDDFDWSYFRAGGAGGQHQNKTSSACRCVHRESGAVGESREHREQSRNKKEAFNRCVATKTFRMWHRLKCAEMLSSETVHQKVEQAMEPKNLKVEVKLNGKWAALCE